MVVVYPARGDALERLAAEELASYIGRRLGARLACVVDNDRAAAASEQGAALLVGRNAISQRVFPNKLSAIPADLGEDGFLLASTAVGKQKYLLLLGGSSRGTLYAVYHYLERYCGVGFFWDGERVPTDPTVPLEGIDEIQKPRFRFRIHHGGGYTSFAWQLADWEREVAWSARHKFNVFAAGTYGTAVWKRALERVGVRQDPITERERSLEETARGTVASARARGLRIVLPGYTGETGKPGGLDMYRTYTANMLETLSDSCKFVRANPGVEYRYFKWGGTSPQTVIHPNDPLYLGFGKLLLGEYVHVYGNDHLFFQGPPGESSIGTTPEERIQIKIDMAKTMTRFIEQIDPIGVFLTGTWPFLDKKFWPKEDVKRFLDAIPDDKVIVHDTWADVNPAYRDLDYFFGKQWTFGVIHAFGGNTHLHGDMEGIIRALKDVAADPRAERCVGFSLAMEIINHNFVYIDLVTRLAWNPAEVELDSFLMDYSVRRYGRPSAKNLAACWKELSRSVYATEVRCNHDLMSPFYWMTHAHWLQGGKGITEEMLSLWDQRKWFILSTRRALETALKEAPHQSDNPLYWHDVNDIARQHLSELFNYRMGRLYRAFQRGDRPAFDAEAGELLGILDSIVAILSTDDWYAMRLLIEALQKAPGAADDVDSRLKEEYSVWDRSAPSDWLLDYTRRDFYETVKYYYRPRMVVLIDALRAAMAKGVNVLRFSEVVHSYKQIEYTFVDKPLGPQDYQRYAGTTLQAVQEALARHTVSEEERAELARAEKTAKKIVQRPLDVDWDDMASFEGIG